VGSYPYGVAFDRAIIWVANFNGNDVTKLRASDGARLATYRSSPCASFRRGKYLGAHGSSTAQRRLDCGDSGNLYATTTEGGDRDYNGTAFRLDRIGGMFTVLFKFEGYAGSYPYAGLVRDPGGNLYGTTVGAGAQSSGACSSSILKDHNDARNSHDSSRTRPARSVMAPERGVNAKSLGFFSDH
jgi:hypothetical protein